MRQLFEIVRRSPRPVVTLNCPSSGAASGTLVTSRGIAVMESPAGTAAISDGSMPLSGFQTRDSKVGGPPLSDIIYPARLELPFVAGQEATYEFAEEVEAEGSTYVDAGITANTALKTELSFSNGKFAAASGGQFVEFILVELPAPVVAGNVRIRARVCPGYLKGT